jgi:hypothetical protein
MMHSLCGRSAYKPKGAEMRSKWALLALMCFVGFGSAANAQLPDQQVCSAHSLNLSIHDCTAVIQPDRKTQEHLAIAIQDPDQSLQIDPNSKSAADFTLTTCLAAMDDLAKVEVMARDNKWTEGTPPPLPAVMSKFVKSLSGWGVMQGENNFFVMIWVSVSGQPLLPPLKVCSVSFDKNVKREDFFNSISASVVLTLMTDARLPQKRFEVYEIKSDRPNKLKLGIQSQNEGTVISAMVAEMRTPQETKPSAEPR